MFRSYLRQTVTKTFLKVGQTFLSAGLGSFGLPECGHLDKLSTSRAAAQGPARLLRLPLKGGVIDR